MATMKMTGCMALVARMPQADQDALLARLDQYQADGIPAERAQVMATNDMLEELRAERSQIFSAIADQFPDLLTVQEGGTVSTDPSAADEALVFSRRQKPDPEKTVTAYKLFRVDPRKPGQLFPLFVNANDPVEIGVWLDADIGPSAAGGKVKSKLGPLAFRPGWHAGDVPIATHIGGKSSSDLKAPDIRPENQVWAEVEMAADRDWQEEANKRGTNAQGKLIAGKAHITDQIPEDGFYRYKTNPNMTGNWIIGGSMKVNRILSDDEVKAINDAAGVADLPRETPFDAEKYGFGAKLSRARQTDTPEFQRWFGDSKVVDENGEPLVVYHGTGADFTAFDVSKSGKNWQYGKDAFFFTSQPDFASEFAVGTGEAPQAGNPSVMPVYLSLQNPVIIELPDGDRYDALDQYDGKFTPDRIAELKADGYDGVLVKFAGESKSAVFAAAFRPEQIKSAIGNSGAFDPANPDIRASRRERTPLGFYSALADSVDGIKTNSAPAQGWKDAIKGLVNKGQVKADEVEWSGINDWLDLQQGKVTREAVAQYLRDGGVQVEEVVLGEGTRLPEYDVVENGNLYDVTESGRVVADGFSSYSDAEDWINEGGAARAQAAGPAKYGKYTLPGGENYREVLLTLPGMVSDAVARIAREVAPTVEALPADSIGQTLPAMARSLAKRYGLSAVEMEVALAKIRAGGIKTQGRYKTTHWDQPNVIAHIRVNDRTDADGKRVLFVEELQSDWGQEGKKKGFKLTADQLAVERERLAKEHADYVREESNTLNEELRGIKARLRELPAGQDRGEATRLRNREESIYRQLRMLAESRPGEPRDSELPAAPFVTKTEGWLNLALKRIMIMAAEGGYDKVAFVTGEQSADRYDLSKQIDHIDYRQAPPSDDTYDFAAVDKNGQEVLNESGIKLARIKELVGKEIAQKIANGEGQRGGGRMTLRGLDLKVGGEGMKTFYDSIVPLAVKKLLPKVGGGQMGEVSIEREPKGLSWPSAPKKYMAQPGFDVTPAMREKVAEGLPMFSRRQRQASGLLVGRDEVGRVNFAPGAKAYDIVANIANKVLDVASMKPVSDELGRAMRNMKVEVEKVQNQIAMTAEELAKIPQAEREMISDVIEGELKAGVLPPQRVLQVAASMQSIMSEQSAELVRLGMLSQEAASRWDQKYLPRFYESKLGDEVKAWSKAAKALLGRQPMMQGIRGNSLKARGMFETIDVADLPAWQAEGWEQRDPNFDPATSTETVVWRDYSRQERENMGEIRDAMFRFVMGYNRSQRDIALGRLYESLAQNYASRGPKDDYVEVPATKVEGTMAPRYGKLAGKYVPKEIMDHLSVNDESMMEGLFKIYKAGLAKWKEGKTVLNPVSHANNVISNITMAHFAGVSYWDAQKYAGAVKDLVTKDAMVQEAKDIGLFTGTFNQSELVASMPPQLRAMAGMSESKIAKMGEGLWDLLAYTVSWNSKKYGVRPVMQWAYENEDLFFRYLVYRDARQRGMAPEDAREYSQQFLFTYDDLPKGARIVRDVGLPFFSYTYKVVPVLARTALEYPWRLAAPAAVAWGANAMMYAMAASLGGDEDDWWGKVLYRYATDPEFRERAKQLEAGERKNLPPYSKGTSAIGTPKAIRLGMDDVTGLPLFLDISKIFPGGDLFDATSNAGGVPLLQPLTPSNPVLTIATAMLANRDLFTGKDVVSKDADTDAEAAQKRLAYLWKQVSPAIAVGNYHFDRGMNVIANMTGQPITLDAGPLGVIDYTGTGRDGLPVQPKYAALQTVGIKVRPYDLDMSEKLGEADKRRVIRELDEQIRRLDRLEKRGAKSFEAADLERERLREKRRRVQEGLTVEGEERK